MQWRQAARPTSARATASACASGSLRRRRARAAGGGRDRRAWLERVRAADAEDRGVAVAINLLFAYVDPAHERLLADAIRGALPDVPVCVSSEIAPIWREYERGNTVIVDAYLRRLIGGVRRRAGGGPRRARPACPRFLLKSNGGQVAARAARGSPCNFDPLRPRRRPDRRAALRRRGRARGRAHARHGRHERGRRRDLGGADPHRGVLRVRVGPARSPSRSST